ncbi:MAG: hypothetical protein OXI63_26390 [Candidatus Poribacteria bacterium]|nr:hypothetical protein [Candidatus Poribacteria bacterium]
MSRLKIERLLRIVFILIFCLMLLPSLVKRLLPAPKIIQTIPALSETTNIPIETKQIRIVFNQPMTEEKNIQYRGMRIKGQPKWVDEKRTILALTLTEPLEPEAFYSIVLNGSLNGRSQSDDTMKGQWGKPLPEYALTFITAPSETMQKRIAAFQSGTLHDTDTDGLDDTLEAELGTLSTTPDTDGDGLSDYEEYCKYRTDPTSADSDRDGISDADWNERREYTYSLRVVLDIKPPWSLASMNDLFQDARHLAHTQSNYEKVEVIVYPYASPMLLPTRYPSQIASKSLKKYIQPTCDLNYSPEMQRAIKEILSNETHTLGVIDRLQQEVGQMKLTVPLYDPFIYTYMNHGELIVDQEFFDSMDRKMTETEIEEVLAVNYFGDSMFKRKQHGACISRARILATMLRAAGIPARVTMGVPLIYYYKGTGEWEHLIKNLNNEEVAGSFSYERPSAPNEVGIVGHSQVEVYLNNHWIRLGYQLNEGPIFAATDLVFIKIIDASDFASIDFTKTWAPRSWLKARPYRTVALSDQAAKYQPHSSY